MSEKVMSTKENVSWRSGCSIGLVGIVQRETRS